MPTDEGYLRVHPRDVAAHKAQSELLAFLLDWRARHALTSAEYLSLLLNAAEDYAALLVRKERANDRD